MNILSKAGGGLKGVISAKIGSRLCDYDEFMESVDLLVGTSAGGLNILGLASGKSWNEIVEFYRNAGPIIFKNKQFGSPWFKAEYKNNPLRQEIIKIVGADKTLGDMEKNIMVTTLDLDNRDPAIDPVTGQPLRSAEVVWMNNFLDDKYLDVPVWKAAMYTAVAPIQHASEDGYLDGGVYAISPLMCALAIARESKPGLDLRDTNILSLGTGWKPKHIKGKEHDWGYYQWAKEGIGVFTDAMQKVDVRQCRALLGDRLYRFGPVLPKGFGSTAVDRIEDMINFADQLDISDMRNWVDKYWF